MSQILFIYLNNKYEFRLKENSINRALTEFSKLITKKMKDLLFLYKGKKISLNKNIILGQTKKTIIISVFYLPKFNNNNSEKSYIICPECKNLAFLNGNNEKITIDNCINKHKNVDLSINDFIKSQIIDESTIKCDICNNNKYLYGDKFYICACKKNICQLCKPNHNSDNNHYYYYDKRFNTCNHSLKYISYCSLCNINLCEKCEEEHINHQNKIIIMKALKICLIIKMKA